MTALVVALVLAALVLAVVAEVEYHLQSGTRRDEEGHR